jgi:N-acetylglucosamine-6-phosphate deacetylase
MIGFIPDGAHVPYFALRNYLRCAGTERCFFVSDAISAARLGPGRYTLAGWTLDIGDDLVARAPGGDHLVGSTATYPRIKAQAAPALGLSPDALRTLTVTNPGRVIGRR